MAHPVLSHLRILVVDNQRAMRGIMRSLLVKIGIRDIVEADNADEAIGTLVQCVRDKNPIDIVFTELHMPVMDGLEFVAHVRRGRTADLDRTLPIVIVTGEYEAMLLDVAKQAGANGVLGKPISALDLLSMISQVAGLAISPSQAASAINTLSRSVLIRPGASGQTRR